MNFYWVNLGESYNEVREHNFLWAPKYYINEKGTKIINSGWKHVPEVCEGDVIICNKDRKIIYVAVATKDAYISHRPKSRTFGRWEKEGYKIEVDLEILPMPFDINEVKNEIGEFYNDNCDPKLITKNNQLSQQYLISLPKSAGAFILDALGDMSLNIQEKINKLSRKKRQTKTTRDAIIKSRVGQGRFREDVLGLWNNTCPITKVNQPDLLIASHILSWQLSNDEEKLDEYNGFPLSPSVDKLFDRGFISFSNTGEMLISEKISIDTVQKLGVNINTKINGLKKENLKYLKRHREIYGFEV